MATDDQLHGRARTDPQGEATAVRLVEQQIDPLASRILQQEVPGLVAACDEQGMQAALRHHGKIAHLIEY